MFSRERQLGWGSVCLFAFGFCLRAWFVRHANPFTGDPQIYGNLARNMVQHQVYSFAVGPGELAPTLIRLPGYPLFLAACFLLFGVGRFAAVLWVQVAVDLGSCLLLTLLARSLFGSRAARFCLLLSCLCPFTANYTATPLTETLTLATIALAFLSLDQWRRKERLQNRWVWALGCACAASLLLRPEQGLLAAVIVPAMLLLGWRRDQQMGHRWLTMRSGAPALGVCLCVLLPLLPWTARNWRTFRVFEPLAPRSATDPGEAVPSGFQRWFRSWAVEFGSTEEVYWNYDGTPIALSDLPSRAFDSATQQGTTAQLLEDYNRTVSPTPVLDARFEAIAKERIKHHAVRYYAVLPLARLGNMLLRPRTELIGIQLAWWRWHDNPRGTLFSLFYATLNLLYLVLGGLGWWRWQGVAASAEERVLLWSMTALVLLRCALLLTLDNSEPRYTLELFPLLMIWSSVLAGQSPVAQISASSLRRS